MKYDECKTKLPAKSVNSISGRSINSIRNKFGLRVDQIRGNVYIMVKSEKKLDESFPNGQFKIPGYVLRCRLDRNQFGGGIMVFVKEDIPSRVLSLNKSIESLFIELNFHKKKWLFCCTYNPNRNNISNHLDLSRRSFDLYSQNKNILSLWEILI